ncbi:MAG: RNA polymerase sigma-70 factor (ECF subfamily) [Pirellulaceae bacterium]|jgi:RNA polymerase sigma-70 factor (ECF subfamily)
MERNENPTCLSSKHVMNELNDDLIQLVKDGDRDALAAYLDAVRLPLMAFIQRRLGDALRTKIEPDDIFQEMSTDAVRSLDSIDLSEREPFSWLCQLIERRIIDEHRRFFEAKKRDAGREVAFDGGSDNRSGGFGNMLAQSMTTPSQAFSRKSREARLAIAVSQLPELQQQALQMRYVENLPSKEIAERIGKSDAAVRVMLTRAVKTLQDLMLEV